MYTRLFTIQQTNFLNKLIKKAAVIILLITAAFSFFSCYETNERTNPIVIWTDNEELASYVELFNATHDAKAVIIYKKEVLRALPPAKDEQIPDLVIASELKTEDVRKIFSPVEFIFGEHKLNKSIFYSKLLEYGTSKGTQYLIPVSFNLPTMVFNKNNASFITDDHIIMLEDIKNASANFTAKNDSGTIYLTMGYAPSWDENFIYNITKLKGASYRESENVFSYDENAINQVIQYCKNWTVQNNESTDTEQNFQFKYLYMHKFNQLSTDKCLFAYMPSNEFFTQNQNESASISFRWLSDGDCVMVEDNIVSLGMYKKSKNPQKAKMFMQWFFSKDTQKLLMERMKKMNLTTPQFGIVGGFSSIKEVNDTVFPIYYRELLENLPVESYLSVPGALPSRWETIKSRIIIPYLIESIDTQNNKEIKSLEQRIDNWSKQAF